LPNGVRTAETMTERATAAIYRAPVSRVPSFEGSGGINKRATSADAENVSRLRLVLAGALGAFILVAAPAGAKLAPGGNENGALATDVALERELTLEINAFRAKRGLRPLAVNSLLDLAAESHSLDMARTGLFAHESSNGTAFTSRVRRFYGTTGYRRWRAGETLLWASPDVDAKRALTMWLNSPEHRRVLLTPAWREIGLSAVHTPSGPRMFESLEVTVVTADFGARTR
jgi:uncharacterized protein YkwD